MSNLSIFLSKFQSKSFLFQFSIFCSIEAILCRRAARCVCRAWLCLSEDAEFKHLVVEVATVELYAEDCLVEMLQLGHGELRGQEFETDGLEVYLTTKFGGCHAQEELCGRIGLC